MKSKKLAWIVYLLSAILPAAAVGIFGFFIGIPLIFCGYFAAAFALLGWVVCRFVDGIFIEKKREARDWQMHIYAFMILAFWVCAILLEKAWIVSAALSLFVANILVFVGVRFDDKDENGIPDCIEKALKLKETLKAKKDAVKKVGQEEADAAIDYIVSISGKKENAE